MRRGFTCGTLLAALALAVLGGARPGAAQSKVLVDAGRDDYLRYCASCHGIDADGNGPMKDVLRAAPPDLTRIAERNGGSFPAARIASVIDGRFAVPAHGTGTMPVWGRVLGRPLAEGVTTEEVARGQIDALVAYLQTIQRPAEPK